MRLTLSLDAWLCEPFAMARTSRRRRTNPRDPLPQPQSEWRWQTLPVWIALTGGVAVGWYIAALGAEFRIANWSFYVLLVFIALFSFGLSRIVNRYVMAWTAKRRARGQEKRILKDPTSRR
jgi:hypothetical protein